MFDDAYVREIVEAARKVGRMTATEFRLFCNRDTAAGYAAEVAEAARRLRISR